MEAPLGTFLFGTLTQGLVMPRSPVSLDGDKSYFTTYKSYSNKLEDRMRIKHDVMLGGNGNLMEPWSDQATMEVLDHRILHLVI